MSVTVYKDARIFDGVKIIENGVLVVGHSQKEFVNLESGETAGKTAASLGDKLEYVGVANDEYKVFTDAEVVSLSGCTVLPGLVNCSARLDTLAAEADDYVDNIGTGYRTFIAYREAAEALNCGVTTIRTLGMPNNIDIGLKDAIAKTMFFGPTILASGPTYAVTAAHGREKYGLIMASGCDELRRAMRIHIARGLDGVTLQVSGAPLIELNGEYQQEMSNAEINALVKHAHGAGKIVTAVANGTPSVSACLNAEANVVLQGRRMSDENIIVMAEKGIGYVPCLVTTRGTKFEAEHRTVVAKAVKAGVKIGVGTEMLPSQPVDGTVAMIRELELMVECGITPFDVLKAATSAAAQLIGSGAGMLTTGGIADFIAVEGVPDEDIATMRKIVLVVKSGRRVFCSINGLKERGFQIMAPGYNVCGGTSLNWAKDATQGVAAPENYNDKWNMYKEI